MDITFIDQWLQSPKPLIQSFAIDSWYCIYLIIIIKKKKKQNLLQVLQRSICKQFPSAQKKELYKSHGFTLLVNTARAPLTSARNTLPTPPGG